MSELLETRREEGAIARASKRDYWRLAARPELRREEGPGGNVKRLRARATGYQDEGAYTPLARDMEAQEVLNKCADDRHIPCAS